MRFAMRVLLFGMGNSYLTMIWPVILGCTAQKNFLPMQPGDLPDTWADVGALAREVGYRPATDLETGVKHFVEWYLAYYQPPSS